ncbi:MAG: hypothetical protein ACRDBX_06565 [Erysipelotrichaceae bacterium]
MKKDQDLSELLDQEVANELPHNRKFKIIEQVDEEEFAGESGDLLGKVIEESKATFEKVSSDPRVRSTVDKVVEGTESAMEYVDEQVYKFKNDENVQNEWKRVNESAKSLWEKTDDFIHSVGESEVVVDSVRKVLQFKEDVVQNEEVQEFVKKGKKEIIQLGEKGLAFLKRTLGDNQDH